MEDKKLHPKTIKIKDALENMNIPKTIYHCLLDDINEIVLEKAIVKIVVHDRVHNIIKICSGIGGLRYC